MQDVFKVETGIDDRAGAESQGEIAEETESVLPIPELEKVVDPDVYILGPYDYLVINVIGTESRSFFVAVLPEGDVFLPGVGAVHADGLTITEFRERLAETFDRFFKNVEIFCYLKTPRRYRVFVTGEVNSPGPVNVYAVERLSDAIERAGDIMGHGSSRFVTVVRGADTLTFDLLRFYVEGDYTNNPFLSNGDRIHVPVADWHAAVMSGVQKPSAFEIIPGETIADIIHLAGGFDPKASPDSVMLTRLGRDGHYMTMTVPAERFDMELRDLDEIHGFDLLAGSRRVFVRGKINRPGRYYLGGGEGVAELIVRAGGLTPQADLEQAIVVRSSGEREWLDLRKHLRPGGRSNMRLDDGDVLEIIPLYENVVVGGEVKAPGAFAFRSDWTVAQYCGMAGGPTEDGSVDRVLIISPDGTVRKGGMDDHPGRGDLIIVKRSRYSILGELFSGLIRLSTIVVSILILTQ
jgi:protein involved in polysaccharide export with SLBB domain